MFLTNHFETSPEFERFTIECRETKTEKRNANSGQSQKTQALQWTNQNSKEYT